MSSSSVVLLTPIANIQRVTLSLTSCPAPPRPQRAGLSARFQSNQVHSLFAALPFDCSGRESKSGTHDSTSFELRSGETVLKPRPLFNRGTFTPRTPQDVQGKEYYQETRPPTYETNIGRDGSIMDGVVSVDKVTDAQTSPTARPGSLLELMDYMHSRADRQTSRRHFTNSAA
ncbi:hypothetical protein HJC23_004100 [Cyclotella cryptica]|uniref:Uncharacterized protein n=1 Tax=Cyclotella cryptica TaxID=29204 RepID=A0ABD3P180_9STRA|eukprot:CCRYP_018210-RA/>CCRYP_018210-RA protein AED:0.38 eAED:0.38 QI:0/-1/0/1/-1/1/1/0/172